jgi:hypothetical protein
MIFVRYWFPPIILCIAIIGNTLGCIVIWRPKLINIGPRNIYKYLFIFDTFYVIEIIISYLQRANFTQFLNKSSLFMCKSLTYFNYSFAPVSPLLLVYISVDRYISVQFPGKRFFLRKEKIQSIYFIFIIIYNLIYYTPVIFYRDLIETNSTQIDNTTNTISCSFNKENLFVISIMDSINRVFIPFSLMLICSFLLINNIFKSRTRIVENFLAEENRTFYAEIRLSTVSLSLNLIFLFLNIPFCVIRYVPSYFSNVNLFLYSYYLFYFSYSINFYILLLSNTLFRSEFFSLFKKNLNNDQNNREFLELQCCND